MSTPLDFTKPLWQMHLIENVNGGCAIVMRLHHCIGDGVALVKVLLGMTDKEADAPWPGAEPEPEKPLVRRRVAAARPALHAGSRLQSATPWPRPTSWSATAWST